MPIYEYRCAACGHCLEVLQKVDDAPLIRCPKCVQESLQKQITAAGIRLKGSGWYETDFKSSNQRNLAGEKTPADGKGEKPAAAKSDQKKKKPEAQTSPTASSSSTAASS